MGCEVGYSLYLPPGYDDPAAAGERYPVVYWLHGFGGSETDGQFPVETVDAGIRSGNLPPMLVVYVNGGRATFYCDAFDGSTKAATTITEELIPHVDATWRTLARREDRALQGMSAGGFGALRLGFSRPDLFGSVVAFAAALRTAEEMQTGPRAETWAKIFGSDGARFEAADPVTLVRARADDLREKGPALRLYCGTGDGLMEHNRRFHRLLDEQRLRFEHVELPDVGHDLKQLAARTGTDALEFAVRHFTCATSREHDGPWVNAPTPAQTAPGTEHHVYFSRAMKRPVGYNIYLPPTYATEPESRFPVVYYLPGMTDSESTHLPIATRLDHAIRSGQVPPMIWVSAYAGRTSWFTDCADGATKAETTLVQELIPHVDARWRTKAGREWRGIEGFSMGGAGAVRLAAKHPDLFVSAVLVSGGFLPVDELKQRHPDVFARVWGDEGAWQATSPWAELQKNAAAVRQRVAFRQIVGTGDFLVEPNRRFHDFLASIGMDVEYDELMGLGHDPRAVFARAGVAGWRFHADHFAP